MSSYEQPSPSGLRRQRQVLLQPWDAHAARYAHACALLRPGRKRRREGAKGGRTSPPPKIQNEVFPQHLRAGVALRPPIGAPAGLRLLIGGWARLLFPDWLRGRGGIEEAVRAGRSSTVIGWRVPGGYKRSGAGAGTRQCAFLRSVVKLLGAGEHGGAEGCVCAARGRARVRRRQFRAEGKGWTPRSHPGADGGCYVSCAGGDRSGWKVLSHARGWARVSAFLAI